MRAILFVPHCLSWAALLLCSLLSMAHAADSPLSLAEAQQIGKPPALPPLSLERQQLINPRMRMCR
jgi:hypothetical protein